MVDFLSGREAPPLLSHYKISGLAGVGGQPTGDALASFDKEAFQSYGLAASANAAFSAQSAIAYAEPLNHLIRETGRVLAGVRVVHWFKERLKNEEDDLFPLLFEGDQDEARQAQAKARNLLDAVRTGKRPDLAGNRFYAMTLSGAAGRVMLRDWMEGSFEDLAASIETWFDELSLINRSGKKFVDTPRIDPLVTCSLKPKKPTQKYKDWVKPVKWESSLMWKAALHRTYPIPGSAVDRAIIAHNRDMVSGEYFDSEGQMSPRMLALLYRRMALIKAFHNRQYRLTKQGGQALKHALDENHPSRAYQCGRLMALLERVQDIALDGVKANIITRYYASAAASPAIVFARLISLSHHHLQKIRLDAKKQKYALGLKGQIAQVMDRIKGAFPQSLDLKEQSLFALGYYHQLAYRKDQTQTPETESAERE